MGDPLNEISSSSTSSSTINKSTSIFLQIVENPDGTITRPSSPLTAPVDDYQQQEQDPTSPVLFKAGAAVYYWGPKAKLQNEWTSHPCFKDITINTTTKTRLRLYTPKIAGVNNKLPIIFFHGGGFVLFSPSALLYHNFCLGLSLSLPAIVASASYRLCPEHPLPAAYHDALDALRCLHSPNADPLVANHGDLSRLFIMGSSSGANIAYRVSLDVALKPAGLIMNQPYFGGVERTESERRSEEDPVLPLRASDLMWRLALPRGADRDHEYSNPTKEVPSEMGQRLPRCLVMGSDGDPLVDRQRQFVGMLKRGGVKVIENFDEGGCHAVELFSPAKAEAMFAELRAFVYGSECDRVDGA